MEESTERRTPAERMPDTRSAILDAVIESLVEVGYAATSTTEVARRAGSTRGAQLHHFGTKEQMMVAAVEHLEAMIRTIDAEADLGRVEPGRERVLAALPVVSQLLDSPLGHAYVELWVASRTNPELTAALQRTDERARDVTRSFFGQEYRRPTGSEVDALIDLTMFAVRGMAIDTHLATEEERAERVALVLRLAPYFERAMETEAMERAAVERAAMERAAMERAAMERAAMETEQ